MNTTLAYTDRPRPLRRLVNLAHCCAAAAAIVCSVPGMAATPVNRVIVNTYPSLTGGTRHNAGHYFYVDAVALDAQGNTIPCESGWQYAARNTLNNQTVLVAGRQVTVGPDQGAGQVIATCPDLPGAEGRLLVSSTGNPLGTNEAPWLGAERGLPDAPPPPQGGGAAAQNLRDALVNQQPAPAPQTVGGADEAGAVLLAGAAIAGGVALALAIGSGLSTEDSGDQCPTAEDCCSGGAVACSIVEECGCPSGTTDVGAGGPGLRQCTCN